MAHTTFTNGVTLTDAAWFQDVDTVAYTLFGNGTSYTGVLTLAGTTQSTSTTTGQAIISGGMGLAKNLWVGGTGNFAGTLTLSGTAANLETGANFISYDGTDAGLSFDSSNNATFSVKATATAFVPSGSTVPTNGMYLPAANTLGWATNSAVGMQMDSTGNLIIGSGYGTTAATGASYKNLFIGGGSLQGNTANGAVYLNANLDGAGKAIYTGGASWYQQSAGAHAWYAIASTTAGVAPTLSKKLELTTTALTTTSAGLFVYGVNSGSVRTLYTETGLADPAIYSNFGNTAGASGENAAAAVLYVRKDNGTSRSINAAGTVNASGADYAEYERKASLEYNFLKGDLVGFDLNGKLVPFSAGLTFGVKSTDPSYVGGDKWGDAESIGEAPVVPRKRRDDESDEEYAKSLREFEESCSAHAQKVESARQWVDRVAYAGKVPVNVYGAQPGNMIVADNGGEAWDLTADPVVPDWFKKYLRSVGRVRRILPDGRAEIAVYVH